MMLTRTLVQFSGLLLLFLLLPPLSFAQSGKVTSSYTYKQYTTADGLPQIQCISITQDIHGFLWVGTKYGMARWDGRTFKTFTPQDGLKSYYFPLVKALSDGSVVAAGHSRYITIFKGDSYSEILLDYLDYRPIVVSIFEINKDEFFVNTLHIDKSARHVSLLFKVNKKTLKITLAKELKCEQLLLADQEGYLLTSNGIFSHWPEINKHEVRLYKDYQLISKVSMPGDYTEFEFARSIDRPILRRKDDLSDFLLLGHHNNTISVTPLHHGIKDLAQPSLLLQSGKHTIFYVNTKGELVRVQKDTSEIIGHVGMVHGLFEDREGNLWATGENGLFCFFRQAVREYHLNLDIGGYDLIWSMAGNRKGSYLYSSYTAGFHFSNDNNSSWVKPKGMVNATIFDSINGTKGSFGALYTSQGGWILPGIGGFYYLKEDRKHPFSYGAHGHETYFSLEDSTNKKIYISAYKKIYAFDEATLSLDAIWKVNPGDESTSMCLALDKFGHLISVGRGGAIRIVSGTPEPLPNCNITKAMSVYKDYKGNLWISALDGLYFYDYRSTLRIRDLPNRNMILSLTGYRHWLVIGGGSDLIFLDLEEFYRSGSRRYHSYDAGSGLTMMEGGQNSFFHDGDGTIFWCCSDKVIRFDPDLLLRNTPLLPPAILNILAMDGENSFQVPNHCNGHGYQELIRGLRQIQIEFGAALFNNNPQLIYRYRLKGLNDEWVSTKNGNVNFMHLNPGNYIFEVQCSTDEINWTESTESIPLKIPYYWFERSLVRILANILLILSIAAIILLIVGRRRRQKVKRLRQMSQLNHLQLQALRSKHIPHFSGNVYNNIDWLIESGQYQEASRYIAILSRLFGKMLSDGDKPANSLADELEFAENYLRLEQLRFKEKLQFIIIHPKEHLLHVMLPNMIVHTLVENAVKHGIMSKKGYGNIWVGVIEIDHGIQVIVKDDGIGLEEAKQYNQGTTKKGLSILCKQIEIFNQSNKEKISIRFSDVQNENGGSGGTEVMLYIPFNYQYL
jgi:hypothetical protein